MHRFLMRMTILSVLCCVMMMALPLSAASQVSPPMSFIQVATGQETVDPYEGVSLEIGLRDPSGRPVTSVPSGTKLYIWATDTINDQVVSHMSLLERSVPEGVYIHETAEDGVLIMDGRALSSDRSLKVYFTSSGQYQIHAVCMLPDAGSFSVSLRADYWPYEMRGSDTQAISVGSTPMRDIGYLMLSPSVDGVLQTGLLVLPNGTITSGSNIPVDAEGAKTTSVDVIFYRTNGMSAGAGLALDVSTNAAGVSLASTRVVTDARGIATISMQGQVQEGDTLRLTLPDGTTMAVPLTRYSYAPQLVRLKINSDEMDVDGRAVQMDTSPVIYQGRTYVPFRAIGEILGAKINYNNTIRTITTVLGDDVITMTIGYNRYAVNGTIRQMDAVPYINSDGRTMVPIRFIAEATGYQVTALYDAQGLTSGVLFSK